MAIKINFDACNNPVEPTLLLSNRNGDIYGKLKAYNIKISVPLKTAAEISFTVYKYIDDKIDILWDKIQNFKLVYCKELDTWFETEIKVNEYDNTQKDVVCKQLGQAELSQINLYNIEINTETDILSDDYEPTIFYNPEKPQYSLLDRVISKAKHYSIAHVDYTLTDLQRTFKFDNISIDDALQKIAEEVGCLFIYKNNSDNTSNTIGINRKIYVYDLYSYCPSCGYRGEFIDKCPKCGSTVINTGYGNDTSIFVSADELSNQIEFKTDVGSVKNCFKLEAGDDLMTATIRNCNPNGSDYIWYITEDMLNDMPYALSNKINEYQTQREYYQNEHEVNISSNLILAYNTLLQRYIQYKPQLDPINSPIVGYPNLMNAYYQTIDFKLLLQSELMPISSVEPTSAIIEIAKLSRTTLSPIAVQNLDVLTKVIADNTVLAMAKCLVDYHYKTEIIESSLDTESNVWTGSFKVTNISDETDTAEKDNIVIDINDDYENFLKQKISTTLSKQSSIISNISDLFNLSLPEFRMELPKYSADYLLSLRNICQSCLDILVEQGISDKQTWSERDPNLYDDLYLPYYKKLEAIDVAISNRADNIETINTIQDIILSNKSQIQEALDFEKYLGEDLFKTFCSYRREDTFSNSNYISDGLSDSELFQNALEFIENAEKEIYKSAELQHSISTTLKNLLVMPKFKVLVDMFEVGNWLRIRVDDTVYRLRLLEYDIDYDNPSELSVVFSDVMKTAYGMTDIESLLKQTESMASSFNYVEHQAQKGQESFLQWSHWREDGLDATLTKIINSADDQDIVIDEHGILCRQKDYVSQNYLPTQLKIVNSTLAITDDNWRTTKTAVGNFFYRDPETGEMTSAYGINGEVIIGHLLLGESLGIYTTNGKMTFNENGLEITNNVNTFKVDPNSEELFRLTSEDIGDLIYVSASGELHITGNGDIKSANYLEDTRGMKIDLSTGVIDTKNFKVDMNGSATINDVTISSGVIKSANYVANTSGTKIDLSDGSIDSKNFKVSAQGSATMNDVTISSGIIKSANYAADVVGMQIDLSTGTIDSKNFKMAASGSATMRDVTITSGIIKSANYNEDVSGSMLNLANGYFTFAGGKLKYNGSTLTIEGRVTVSDDDGKAILDDARIKYYRDSDYVGFIGTNTITTSGSTHYGEKGIVFDLNAVGDYMSWGARNSDATGVLYNQKLAWFRNGGFYFNDKVTFTNPDANKTILTIDKSGTINYYNDIDMHNYDLNNVDIAEGTLSNMQVLGTYTISSGATADVWRHIDMHGYDIMNVDIVNPSDRKLKKEIMPTNINALEILHQIQPRQFKWKETNEYCELGFVADELESVKTKFVADIGNGMQGIKLLETIPYLIKAIQELDDKVNNINNIDIINNN